MQKSSLSRFLLTGLSAVALILVFAQSAFADPRDFLLKNDSAVDIAFAYVSPTATNDWGDDILGSDLLASGQSTDVTFRQFDGRTCLYDVKVVGAGGEEGYLYKVDLCTVDTVTFS